MFKRLFLIIFGFVGSFGVFALLYRMFAFGPEFMIPRISTLLASFSGVDFNIDTFVKDGLQLIKLNELIDSWVARDLFHFVPVNNLYDVGVNIVKGFESVIGAVAFIIDILLFFVEYIVVFIVSMVLDVIQFVSIVIMWIGTNEGIAPNPFFPIASA